MKTTLNPISLLVIILICFVSLNLQGNKYLPVNISNSQAISFTSSINKTDYELQISLPSHYHESDKRYPVVYLLDANNDFPLVTSISRRLYQEDNLQPIIIVGISYKKDAYIHRISDYTPTKMTGDRQDKQINS